MMKLREEDNQECMIANYNTAETEFIHEVYCEPLSKPIVPTNGLVSYHPSMNIYEPTTEGNYYDELHPPDEYAVVQKVKKVNTSSSTPADDSLYDNSNSVPLTNFQNDAHFLDIIRQIDELRTQTNTRLRTPKKDSNSFNWILVVMIIILLISVCILGYMSYYMKEEIKENFKSMQSQKDDLKFATLEQQSIKIKINETKQAFSKSFHRQNELWINKTMLLMKKMNKTTESLINSLEKQNDHFLNNTRFIRKKIAEMNSTVRGVMSSGILMRLHEMESHKYIQLWMDNNWYYISEPSWCGIGVYCFQKNAAEVVCRTMGFKDNTDIVHSKIPKTNLKILNSYFTCEGTEKTILQCNMKHFETAYYISGVKCSS